MASRWGRTERPHGDAYDARWAAMAEKGENPHGEADFVCRFQPTSVLDAGCGTGRVAIELDRRGVDVVGVDLDPGMLETARAKAPELMWLEDDLVDFDLGRSFDVVVAAGNVMIFLAPGTEALVVTRLAHHLVAGGVLIAGFQLTSDHIGLDDYDAAAAGAGLELDARLCTWQGDPWSDGGDYAVSVHRRPLR